MVHNKNLITTLSVLSDITATEILMGFILELVFELILNSFNLATAVRASCQISVNMLC